MKRYDLAITDNGCHMAQAEDGDYVKYEIASVLLEALYEAQAALSMLTDPERIQQTRVHAAWAIAVASEAKARAAIAKATGEQS